ncbi:MAG: conserved exported protein of unknown function [Rhodospirillaceae bacterium]|nr:MAG: conserved exported protein of unknown function [Rhodospirillaceae bacterium]
MRVLGWIIGTSFAIIMVIFAVSNRGLVRLDLWLLPFGIEMPVYLMVLGPLMIGFLFGVVVMWLAAGRLRARVRARTREVRLLEQKALKRQFTDTAPDPAQA